MPEAQIKLNKIADIHDFINLAMKCRGEVTVYSGKYVIDGKSLMGVMSLNLSEPIKIEIDGDIPCDVREGIKKYLV
jgi:phosphotransferase system HPr-like phosphotransfer protein